MIKTTERPDLQAAAEAALRRGVMRADEAAGWRGVIAHVAFPVDWNAPEVALPPGAQMLKVAVVESVGAQANLVLEDEKHVVLSQEGVAWTGKRLVDILRRGDVILIDLDGRQPRLVQIPQVDGAMVVMDPRTGEVQALVGGFSRERSVFNRVMLAKRQPGSSFKPIVYSAAFLLGYDAASPLIDASIVLEQGPGQVDWRPNDAKAAGKGGLITVQKAMELSRNVATVRLVWTVGIDEVSNIAKKMGFDFDKMTYSVALGSLDVTPLQMALAYSAFANGGKIPRPHFITEINARAGALVRKFHDEPAQVLDPVVAAQMASLLRGVVERGTAAGAFKGFQRPIAGKTGTTNGFRDAWFIGFANDMVAAIWVGRDDNQPLAYNSEGGNVAAPILRDFLDVVGDKIALTPPPVPDGLVTVNIDENTGLPAKNGIPELMREAPDAAQDAPVSSTRPRRPQRPTGPIGQPQDIHPSAPPSDYLSPD